MPKRIEYDLSSARGRKPKSGPVLVITEVFPPQVGGSGRWLYEVFSRIESCKSICVLAPPLTASRVGSDSISAPLELSRTYRIPEEPGFFARRGIIAYIGLLREVIRLHRKHHFHRIYCGSCLTPGWVAWLAKLLLGIPYVCFVHGEEVFFPESGPATGMLSSRQLRLQMRLILRSATCLIANSNNTSQILRGSWGIPSDRVRVMHPGVDANHYVPAEVSPATRNSLDWTGRRIVLTVGRLQRRKGHDMMIRALPTIVESIPNVLYVIVGAGEELTTLKALVHEHRVAELVQFRTEASDEELLNCYQQCDLFVLANRQIGGDIEGFGIVLLEAQACGKPVIAGLSGGTGETLSKGVSGILVDCNSPDSLSDAVVRMLKDEQRLAEMGNAARTWIQDKFDWGKLAVELERQVVD